MMKGICLNLLWCYISEVVITLGYSFKEFDCSLTLLDGRLIKAVLSILHQYIFINRRHWILIKFVEQPIWVEG